ncbi:glycosyltransferase family 4 protein [soil metagenome]
MTRILLSPSAYYPSLGGVEEIARNLAIALRHKGYEVAIATNQHPADLPAHEIHEGIDVYRMPFEYPSRSASGILAASRAPLRIGNFLRFVQSYAPDVVHVVCPSSNSLYCYVAKKVLRTKLLVTLQGEFFMDANQIYQKSAFARFCASQLLNSADAVTACSQYVLDDARNRFNFQAPVEEVLFNGVDLSEPISPQEDTLPKKPYIFAIGRLVQNKGFDYLLRSYHLMSKNSAADLVLAGDGDAAESLKNLASELQISDRVHFVGRQGRGEVARYFKNCMFFVLPSHIEPFGIVCLEAMRAGKPVVATRAGGPPEFIEENITGLLVESQNESELAQAMQRLCSDKKLVNTMGKNASEKVAEFSWLKITEKYVALYEDLLGAKKSAPVLS